MVELDLSRAIAVCDGFFDKADLSLKVHDGHENLSDILAAFGKRTTTPKMDPAWNDFTSQNVFWLVLYDGEIPIAGLGARFEEVGREDVMSYWERTNLRHYGPENGVVTHHLSGDAMFGLGGRMVYIGELMVSDRRRGSRPVLRRLLLAMHCLASLRWGADWHYAFIRSRDARAGMERCYHFTRMMPGFQRWRCPPSGRDCSEWLASISRSEIIYLADLYGTRPDWL